MTYWLDVFTRRAGFGPGREMRLLGPYTSRHAAFAFAHVPLAGGWRYDHTIEHAADGAVRRIVFEIGDAPPPPACHARPAVLAAA